MTFKIIPRPAPLTTVLPDGRKWTVRGSFVVSTTPRRPVNEGRTNCKHEQERVDASAESLEVAE